MKKIFKCISLLFLISTCSAYSQTAPVTDLLLDNMVGKWVLKGTIGGQETTHDIVADWVLGHQYVQIRETSREKDTEGKPVYAATVFITWEQSINQYTCLWLDNTGNGGLKAQAVGHADRNGDNIGFVFTISSSSTFNTTFSYDKSSDSWKWNMDSRENDKIEPFARVKLTRENKTK
jgi:hypothetical protein